MRSWAWSAAGMVLPSRASILLTNGDRLCSSPIGNTCDHKKRVESLKPSTQLINALLAEKQTSLYQQPSRTESPACSVFHQFSRERNLSDKGTKAPTELQPQH